MRNTILGFCLLAAGCAGSEPSSPSAPSPSSEGTVVSEARAGTELPFSGTLEAVETHQFQPPNFIVAHLEGKGIASHIGRFTSVSDFTINTVTAMGVGTLTLTAANGDQLFATLTGQAVGGTPDRLQLMKRLPSPAARVASLEQPGVSQAPGSRTRPRSRAFRRLVRSRARSISTAEIIRVSTGLAGGPPPWRPLLRLGSRDPASLSIAFSRSRFNRSEGLIARTQRPTVTMRR